jgi:glycosyltransferase involved in cell wall biosynthesis
MTTRLLVKSVRKQQRPLVSVIVCAHNEEQHIDKSLPSIMNALKGILGEIVFVADRCTDKTVEKAKKYPVKIIEKTWMKWENSYSEALQIGYANAEGTYVSIVDADIVVSPNFFKDLIPPIKGKTVSVAAQIVTYPDAFLNRLMNAWEKTSKFAPLGKTPRGAARVILKKALDEINGFKDVPPPDTDIDLRFTDRGYKSIGTSKTKAYHIRRVTLKKIINGQINSGRGRYTLGIGLVKTVGHATLRVRPFTIYGWLLERTRNPRCNN